MMMDGDGRVGSFDEAWKHQVLAGLALTPTERLRWLEEAILFAQKAGAVSRQQLFEKHALMGDKIEPRRLSIEKHGKEVKNLNIIAEGSPS